MKTFFMIGMLCLLNPLTGQEQCAYIHENPINFYAEEKCKDEAVKKVNEIATNMTSKGFFITQIYMNCVVDKNKLNT
jgi:hypothetical protein|tara:strand:- start:275 stop:505 length:231 start_codon:yes stop_codon:yes gene_type:complete